MIGRLRGVIAEKHPPFLLVDVGGVGYELEAPMSTFYVLPEVGKEVVLHTHLAVREDAHTLFAFATPAERTLFRSLIKVSGVGAKMALAILSGIGTDDFVRSVRDGDATALTRAPGVGKKTAERLVVEMRDRLKDWGMPEVLPAGGAPAALAPRAGELEDAVSALIALGYKPAEASRMVGAVEEEGLASEEIIRRALQGVMKRK
ncbi:Holliday junction branch migration protein RuvA [Endothiovibrio diazotrophicus]